MKLLPKKATEPGSAYDRCLVALAHRDTNAAVAALGRIGQPALRAVAQDQISIVEELERRLHHGEQPEIEPPLIARLVGEARVTYARLLRATSPLVPRVPRAATTTSKARDNATKPEVGRSSPKDASHGRKQRVVQRVNAPPFGKSISPQDLTNAEAELCAKIAPMTLDRQFGLHEDAVRQLCAIAVKSWVRRTSRFGIDLLRVSRTEIGMTAICLREHLAGNAALIPFNVIASSLAVGESHVVTVAAALRQYLLRGSGWVLVKAQKTGVRLVPDSAPD